MEKLKCGRYCEFFVVFPVENVMSDLNQNNFLVGVFAAMNFILRKNYCKGENFSAGFARFFCLFLSFGRAQFLLTIRGVDKWLFCVKGEVRVFWPLHYGVSCIF